MFPFVRRGFKPQTNITLFSVRWVMRGGAGTGGDGGGSPRSSAPDGVVGPPNGRLLPLTDGRLALPQVLHVAALYTHDPVSSSPRLARFLPPAPEDTHVSQKGFRPLFVRRVRRACFWKVGVSAACSRADKTLPVR